MPVSALFSQKTTVSWPFQVKKKSYGPHVFPGDTNFLGELFCPILKSTINTMIFWKLMFFLYNLLLNLWK